MPEPLSEKTLREWQRAVASVYFHGRRKIEPAAFNEAEMPFEVLPLEKAVDVLTKANDARVLKNVQMALADLCRCRYAWKEDTSINVHLERLAKSLLEQSVAANPALGTSGLSPESLTKMFTNIHLEQAQGDAAYEKALKIMLQVMHAENELSRFSGYQVEQGKDGSAS